MDGGVLIVVGASVWIALSLGAAVVLGRVLAAREARERPAARHSEEDDDMPRAA